jgi:predicted secreted protein
MKRFLLAMACVATLPLWAQTTPVTTQLDAQASMEVDNDELTVVLSITRDGPRPAALTQSVLGVLTKVTEQVKRVDGVQQQVGDVSAFPIWGPKGKTDQWSARASLVLVSKNLGALAALASELTADMQLSSVNFHLSKEKRKAVEKQLMGDLAAAVNSKSSAVAQAFAFKGYAIQSLNLSEQRQAVAMPMLRMATPMASAMADSVPIPTQAGKSMVSLQAQVTVLLQP